MLGHKIVAFVLFCSFVKGSEIKSNTTTFTPETSTEKVTTSPALLDELNTINAYHKKICAGEPTCHLANLMPKYDRTMQVRNCMCDSDCFTFGDCCQDSPFYNETQQRLVHGTIECVTLDLTYNIYIKRKCPSNFNDTNIKVKCETWSANLKSTDPKIIAPVTSIATKLTYANEYCASCHHDNSLVPWIVTYTCSLHTDFTVHEADVKFDAENQIFYTDLNRTRADCFQYRSPPPNLMPLLRDCLSVVSTCPNNADYATVDLCKTVMNVVLDNNLVYYKNVHCAACNGIKNTTICPQPKANPIPYTAFSTAFTADDKAVGSINPCDDSADPIIRNKFCTS